MRLSAQEEYGLRCILQLARSHRRQQPLTIVEISGREALTQAYVGKLLRVLRQAGLIKSVRGQKGGYELARSPDEISVYQVLDALDGPIYSADFCNRYTGNSRDCVHTLNCSIRSMWDGLEQLVAGFLSQWKLSDLVTSEPKMRRRVEDQLEGLLTLSGS